MEISNIEKCCATCGFWNGLYKKEVGKVILNDAMAKSRCNCQFIKKETGYYTHPKFTCNFYQKSKHLKWYEEGR